MSGEVVLGCDVCGVADRTKLYGNVDGVLLCAECWKRRGRPWPKMAADPAAAAELEARTKAKMMRRGGSDRVACQKGRV